MYNYLHSSSTEFIFYAVTESNYVMLTTSVMRDNVTQ